MATQIKGRRGGTTGSGRPASGRRPTVERRRSAPSAAIGTSGSAGAITLSVMRSMVAAADALRSELDADSRDELTAVDLALSGSALADRVRHYQSALRQFVKDWLRNRRQMAWLVDSSSGRTLAVDHAAPSGAGLAADTEVVLAEDQPLNGIRRRVARDGIGIPVASRSRRAASDPILDAAHTTAARPWTVVVGVEHHVDRRVRTVRVVLVDPAESATHAVGRVRLPLAADFTAPVALTLGLERRPAATAYGLRDGARRRTVEGFSALTPFELERAPLVLMEGIGLSPTTLAQIANEVAGDPLLRERYQVWLYRYPVAAPLFFAAATFRADLTRFLTRLTAATGRTQRGRVAIVASGPGAVIGKSLLIDSGSSIWDAVFTAPPDRLDVGPADRALLEALLRWPRAAEVERLVVLSEPQHAEALTAGVGARAVQLLLRQSAQMRGAIERIYGREKHRLAAPLLPRDPVGRWADSSIGYPEPICDAIAAAALAAERALLARLGTDEPAADGAQLYLGAAGLRPVAAQPPVAADAELRPLALARALDWLRPE